MIITLRQSEINEWLLCPERFKAQKLDGLPSPPTDATAIGTATHAGFELILAGGSYVDGLAAMREAFYEETQVEGYRWIQVKTPETALKHAQCALDNLVREVLPTLGTPLFIEEHFELPFIRVRDDVEVHLHGTIDFADEGGPWDWKTRKADGTKYKAGWGGEGWKLKRFGVQPTVYTWAAEQLGLFAQLDTPPPYSFTYAAASKTTPDVDILEVQRGPADYAWLEVQVRDIANMILSGIEDWPKIDQHALCSADWCPNWERCKGAAHRKAIDAGR
jgi:hypothetical protein